MQRIQFRARQIMNAEAARRDQLADLVNPQLAAVEAFPCAACNEPTVINRKDNRFEQILILAVERAVDEYLSPVRALR